MTSIFSGFVPMLGVAPPAISMFDIFWILFTAGIFFAYIFFAMREKGARKRSAPRSVPTPAMEEAPQPLDDGFSDGFAQEPMEFDSNFK